MTSCRRLLVYATSYLGMGAIVYLALTLLTFAFAALTLRNGVVFANEVMVAYQRIYYFGGFRRILQADPRCVMFDPNVLYKPRDGECKFDNPEFKTSLHFDSHGRVSKHPDGGTGIAVLGDSFAMGWGVDDSETFAAVLEGMIGRPVYNLGVSSYETYRELLRLEESGLVAKIDTIVIQYCENDLDPNEVFLNRNSDEQKKQFSHDDFTAAQGEAHPTGYLFLLKWTLEAVRLPVLLVKYWASRHGQSENFSQFFTEEVSLPGNYDFRLHYESFNRVLERFPWVRDKRLVVFYANGSGVEFEHFAAAARPPNSVAATYVDLDVKSDGFFVIDDHMNRRGHQQVANRLLEILAR